MTRMIVNPRGGDAGRMGKLNPSDVIACALLLILPAVLPFIRRAAPPMLIAMGLFAAIILWREARLWEVVKSHLRNTVTLSFMAFVAWATISLGWSTAPFRGLVTVATCLLLAISFLLVSEFPLSKHAHVFLMIGLAIGGAVITFDFLSGSPLLRFVHKEKAEAWRYNMVAVTYITLTLALLVQRDIIKSIKTLLVLALIYAATFLGESETAKLVLLLFPVLFLITMIMPLSKIKPAFFCLFVVIFLFAASGMPGLIYLKTLVSTDIWRHASGDERIAIWSGVADFAFHGLPLGWGVEAISAPRESAYFVASSREIQWSLSLWHPHNNFLQVATELGLPGIAISFGFLGLAVGRCFPHSRVGAAGYVTFVTAIMGIAAISHGFWQSWWWAAVLIGWYALVGGAEQHDRNPN